MVVSALWGVFFLTNSLTIWEACVLLILHGCAGAMWGPGEQLMLYRQVSQTRAQNLSLRTEARQIRSQHPAQPRIDNSPPPA